MNRIAVIGVGQLGSRHLQGLSQVDMLSTLYLVDPVEASLEQAVVRISEMPANDNIDDVVTCSAIKDLPDQIDLAIIATTADIRFELLKELLTVAKVKYVILEKVLFQKIDEYHSAGELLDLSGARAWVNCPRRMYDVYNQVKNFFSGDEDLSLHVQGGEWGLGCNSVHFLDLFHFLTGKIVQEFDTSRLDPEVYPSKRPQFYEFGGTLRGYAGKSLLELGSSRGSRARHLILLRAENRSCLVDEIAGKAWFLDESKGWSTVDFKTPYQSQLSNCLADSILKQGGCVLPDYSMAKAIHLPFVRLLQNYFVDLGNDVDFCPIT